ncbi:MAG: PPP family 3-phenylpropionic acid transporter [Myxococcota bacterium]|jgi:PPP family 3-phenylpropionic acid transporter
MSVRARLVLWYVSALGALGAIPYLSAVLADKGVSDQNIALYMAILPLAAIFAAPAWSWIADRQGSARTLLTVTTLGTTAGLGLLAASVHPLLLVAGLAVYAISRAPQTPIVDALALRSLGNGGRDYGRVRLWGSVAFLIVAYAAGWVRTVWGVGPIVIGAVLLTGTIVSSRMLPHSTERVPKPKLSELVAVFARGTSALLTVSCILHGLSLTFYNNFMARHIETIGLPSSVMGTVVVVGVGTEVAVMALSPWLLDRVRPSRLLLFAFLASVPRWLGTAHITDATLLIALQSLHGLSFGLFWVAAVPAFARHSSPSVARSAQAVLTATAFGIGPLLAVPIAWVLLADHPPASLYEAGAIASALAALVMAPVALRRSRPATVG